jgi:hypothetical protein
MPPILHQIFRTHCSINHPQHGTSLLRFKFPRSQHPLIISLQHHRFHPCPNLYKSQLFRSCELPRGAVEKIRCCVNISWASNNGRDRKQENGNDRDEHKGGDKRKENAAGVNRLVFSGLGELVLDRSPQNLQLTFARERCCGVSFRLALLHGSITVFASIRLL